MHMNLCASPAFQASPLIELRKHWATSLVLLSDTVCTSVCKCDATNCRQGVRAGLTLPWLTSKASCPSCSHASRCKRTHPGGVTTSVEGDRRRGAGCVEIQAVSMLMLALPPLCNHLSLAKRPTGLLQCCQHLSSRLPPPAHLHHLASQHLVRLLQLARGQRAGGDACSVGVPLSPAHGRLVWHSQSCSYSTVHYRH